MPFFSRFCLTFGLLVVVTVLAPAGLRGAEEDETKANSKRVKFQTTDGVELEGTYYPNVGGKKDACVLLLHDFDRRKGGDSHQHGWDSLAARLQKEGYAVLSFDFRGFGNSKTLDSRFWNPKFTHNTRLRGFRKVTKPIVIDYKEFPSSYYPHLVNDIAAAKAFLDQKNDLGELTTSSVIVIGAGNGATLGAFWMATQTRLKRDNNNNPLAPPQIAPQPESKSLAGAVWLSISPSLAGARVPIVNWIREVGGEEQVPMAFVYGGKDDRASQVAKYFVKLISTKTRVDPKKLLTGEKPIKNTSLSGSRLLHKSLDTEEWIAKTYLHQLMEKRGSRLQKSQKLREHAFLWFQGQAPRVRYTQAKARGEEMLRPVPLTLFGFRR